MIYEHEMIREFRINPNFPNLIKENVIINSAVREIQEIDALILESAIEYSYNLLAALICAAIKCPDNEVTGKIETNDNNLKVTLVIRSTEQAIDATIDATIDAAISTILCCP
ncbi:MAG: hypothetical protein PWQ10_504 [Patescibacteria group bacterium]|nr:hypothetical protein [Patescibacteria group bacterium]